MQICGLQKQKEVEHIWLVLGHVSAGQMAGLQALSQWILRLCWVNMECLGETC